MWKGYTYFIETNEIRKLKTIAYFSAEKYNIHISLLYQYDLLILRFLYGISLKELTTGFWRVLWMIYAIKVTPIESHKSL